MNEAGRMAVQALREADESRRLRGRVMSHAGTMCACAVLAKSLGIPFTVGTDTGRLVADLEQAMGIPLAVAARIPEWNDDLADSTNHTAEEFQDFMATTYDPSDPSTGKLTLADYRYSWRDIADMIEAPAEPERDAQ